MMVREARLQDPNQVGLIEDDSVVQALPPNRADELFHIGRLSRRARRDNDFLDAHMLNMELEVDAINGVAVTNQEPRGFIIRERLDDLPGRPARSWMGRDVVMGDPMPVMSKDNEAVQQLKSYGRHDEEIDRDDVADMILKERTPRLRRRFAVGRACSRETSIANRAVSIN